MKKIEKVAIISIIIAYFTMCFSYLVQRICPTANTLIVLCSVSSMYILIISILVLIIINILLVAKTTKNEEKKK